jgi:hypothetical protein
VDSTDDIEVVRLLGNDDNGCVDDCESLSVSITYLTVSNREEYLEDNIHLSTAQA